MSERLYFRLDAPFAACRPFVAGWYRPTAPFLTPSAVYGLLLNVAGVESRLWEHEKGHDGKVPASLTRPGLPAMRLALGVPEGEELPRVETLYQQLHNYPQDETKVFDPTTGKKERKSVAGFNRARGSKFNITPVRREVLCGVRAAVAVECDADLADRLRRGLRGEATGRTYGLPFLGDNSFLLDRLEETPPRPARWYERVDPADRPRAGTARLTVRVDRADMSGTVSHLFAPRDDAEQEPPPGAWVEVGGDAGPAADVPPVAKDGVLWEVR